VLFGWLARAGFGEEEFRAACYFTAVTKCYPGPSKGGVGSGDRVPTARERALCEPFLRREIALLHPKLIITVGRTAMVYFLGNVDFTDAIGRVYVRESYTVVPLPHPSGVSRWTNQPENMARLWRALNELQTLVTQL
jgi:uracil-DNA glycosylase